MSIANSEHQIYGAVIAGGQSRRMGKKNKILLNLGGETMLSRAARKLHEQTGRIVVNINDKSDLPEKWDEKWGEKRGYEIISDNIAGFTNSPAGPLAGILSVLKWLKIHHPLITHLATIPVDVPFFPSHIVAEMSKAIGENLIAVPFYEGYSQQLFSLWSIECIESMNGFLANPENREVMKYIQRQKWTKVNLMKQKHNPFININTVQDWQQAQILLRDKIYNV